MPDIQKYHFMLGVRFRSGEYLDDAMDVIQISLPDFYSVDDVLAILKEMRFHTIGEIWQDVIACRGHGYKRDSDSLQCPVLFRKVYDSSVQATAVFDYDHEL